MRKSTIYDYFKLVALYKHSPFKADSLAMNSNADFGLNPAEGEKAWIKFEWKLIIDLRNRVCRWQMFTKTYVAKNVNQNNNRVNWNKSIYSNDD